MSRNLRIVTNVVTRGFSTHDFSYDLKYCLRIGIGSCITDYGGKRMYRDCECLTDDTKTVKRCRKCTYLSKLELLSEYK